MDINSYLLWAKFLTGKLTIHKGELCEFSKRFWDIHDYPLNKGGNGIKNDNITYICPYCNKAFKLK